MPPSRGKGSLTPDTIAELWSDQRKSDGGNREVMASEWNPLKQGDAAQPGWLRGLSLVDSTWRSWFDSGSGHMPVLWAPCPVGEKGGRAGGSPSMFLSRVNSFLSSHPLFEINKTNFCKI